MNGNIPIATALVTPMIFHAATQAILFLCHVYILKRTADQKVPLLFLNVLAFIVYIFVYSFVFVTNNIINIVMLRSV